MVKFGNICKKDILRKINFRVRKPCERERERETRTKNISEHREKCHKKRERKVKERENR